MALDRLELRGSRNSNPERNRLACRMRPGGPLCSKTLFGGAAVRIVLLKQREHKQEGRAAKRATPVVSPLAEAAIPVIMSALYPTRCDV